MPALPAVANVLKAVIGEVIGDVATNTILHWLMGGSSPDQSDLDTLASEIHNGWVQYIMPLKSQTVTLNSVELTDLTSDTGLVGLHAASQEGSLAQTALPPNCCFVLSHKIAVRYRGGHPRTYLSGFPENQLGAGSFTWATNYLTGVPAAFENFRGYVAARAHATATPLALVAVSYRHGGQQRDVPAVYPIIATKAQQRLCSQRRRLGPLLAE